MATIRVISDIRGPGTVSRSYEIDGRPCYLVRFVSWADSVRVVQ